MPCSEHSERWVSGDLAEEVDAFVDGLALRRSSAERSTGGSAEVPGQTVALLKKLVTHAEWKTAKQLMTVLRSEGRLMASGAGSADVVVGNLVRRVLKLVREDYRSCAAAAGGPTAAEADPRPVVAGGDGDPPDSLHNLVSSNKVASKDDQEDHALFFADLKDRVLQSIDELAMETETGADEIADQALQHIHASEVILTVGRSQTVELFLKRAAAKGRSFQVIVAEAAPFYQGHDMATSLAKAHIQTTLVTDSAIFATMSRVNKVIVGTHAIMANGGLKGHSGLYTAALAAQHYSVPLYVCSSMLKLTPSYFTAGDQESFGHFVSPQEVLRGGSGGGEGLAHGKLTSHLRAACPLFEYVPPELVTLFISNMSGHAPSYVYRLLSELYHPEDYEL